jgi:hypothetical protein
VAIPTKEATMADERDETRATPVTSEEDLEVKDEAGEDVRGGDKSTTPSENLSLSFGKPEITYKP